MCIKPLWHPHTPECMTSTSFCCAPTRSLTSHIVLAFFVHGPLHLALATRCQGFHTLHIDTSLAFNLNPDTYCRPMRSDDTCGYEPILVYHQDMECDMGENEDRCCPFLRNLCHMQCIALVSLKDT